MLPSYLWNNLFTPGIPNGNTVRVAAAAVLLEYVNAWLGGNEFFLYQHQGRLFRERRWVIDTDNLSVYTFLKSLDEEIKNATE